MPILPDDPEAALAVLGELAERERRAKAVHDEALRQRNEALAELIDTRPDVNKTRAGLRMRLKPRSLYEIVKRWKAHLEQEQAEAATIRKPG